MEILNISLGWCDMAKFKFKIAHYVLHNAEVEVEAEDEESATLEALEQYFDGDLEESIDMVHSPAAEIIRVED